MENSAEVRIKRAEQNIETLRTTQNALLDRYDRIYKTLIETRDIATENRSRLVRVEDRIGRVEDRLGRVEDRIGRVEERLDRVEKRLDRVEEQLDRVEKRLELVEEVVLENRAILLNIADHLDLTLERPPQGPQPD